MTTERPTLRFGVATVAVRDDLTPYDEVFVPEWDENFQVDDRLFETLAVCAADDIPALLVGPAGCGKTQGVRMIAALLNQPVRKISLNADVRSSDFVGQKSIDVDEATGTSIVTFKDGILPDAMRRGHWLVLDEFDATPPGIAFVLQSVLEPGHVLTLLDNYGEVVTPHPSFRLFATGNTIGKGDESGLYTGTNVMNEATLDRFVTIECTYVVPSVECEILTSKTGVAAQIAKRLVDVATLVRQGFDKNECFCTFSTRRLLAWAAFTTRFGANDAAVVRGYKLAVASKLGREDRLYVAGVVQRVIGLDVAR